MTQLKIGDNAPDFTAKLMHGENEKEFTVSAQKTGLVLYFYPKDMTSGCTVQAEEFTQMNAEFKKAGFQAYGISKDSLKSHQNFICKKELSIPLISDEDHKIAELYGAWVEKSMYGKKYMGMSRDTFVISADGKIMHIWRKVKAKGHVAEVKNLLVEAGFIK
jgi:peroxiredoxin Q/BCP